MAATVSSERPFARSTPAISAPRAPATGCTLTDVIRSLYGFGRRSGRRNSTLQGEAGSSIPRSPPRAAVRRRRDAPIPGDRRARGRWRRRAARRCPLRRGLRTGTVEELLGAEVAVRCDDRRPAGHRLDDDARAGLAPARRQAERGGPREVAEGIRLESREQHVPIEICFAGTTREGGS